MNDKLDIEDGTPLIEKIMAHFGWYKVKKVDLQVENLEVIYNIGLKVPEIEEKEDFTVKKKPVLKKATTRKVKKNAA
jgi:hypothetical protein